MMLISIELVIFELYTIRVNVYIPRSLDFKPMEITSNTELRLPSRGVLYVPLNASQNRFRCRRP